MTNRSPGAVPRLSGIGVELAVTYLNDKAKKHVELLAHEVEAAIVMPLDMRVPGQLEAVFDRISEEWGDRLRHPLDCLSPKEALQGRVVDVPREGFLSTMEIPAGRSFGWRIWRSR